MLGGIFLNFQIHPIYQHGFYASNNSILHLQYCNCFISLTHFSENRINNDPGVQTILSEICNIRKALTKLQHYDTISVPLVYTQVRPKIVTSLIISKIKYLSVFRYSKSIFQIYRLRPWLFTSIFLPH